MHFREKAKNLFKTKSRGSSLAKTDTNGSDRDRWPSNVYRPDEPMPRMKYRAPPRKEHKEKLEAFNFADAWRKTSFQSSHSPMGTRAPSRQASIFSVGRKSFGSKSDSGRTSSVPSIDAEKSGLKHREAAAMLPTLMPEPEQEGDDDVANVGLSRVQSRDKPALSPPPAANEPQTNDIPNGLHKTTTAHDHQQFTEQDLELAMQRTHLQVPTES